MRIYSVVSAAVSGILMAGVSSVALAGSCGGGGIVCNSGFNAGIMPYEGVRSATCNTRLVARAMPVQNCNPGVVVHPGGADPLAAVHTYANAPYGYLKTFDYKNSPNVNVMRVRSRAPMVNLNDVPTGYRGGCNPSTTGYCRAGGARPMAAPMPVMRPMLRPMPRPMIVQAPVMRAPVEVRTGQGYNPANFASRQYGSNVLTPGTAHIPTSIVDRSPITHIGGVPQQRVSSVTTVNGTYGQGYSNPRPVMGMRPAPRPAMRPRMGGNVIGHVSGGSYTYRTAGTPDYWEKTSGATVVDGLPATQILCRRSGTAGTSRTVNVVRPVIGVPRPVPVAVRVPVRPVCGTAPRPMMPRAMPRVGGRWTY